MLDESPSCNSKGDIKHTRYRENLPALRMISCPDLPRPKMKFWNSLVTKKYASQAAITSCTVQFNAELTYITKTKRLRHLLNRLLHRRLMAFLVRQLLNRLLHRRLMAFPVRQLLNRLLHRRLMAFPVRHLLNRLLHRRLMAFRKPRIGANSDFDMKGLRAPSQWLFFSISEKKKKIVCVCVCVCLCRIGRSNRNKKLGRGQNAVCPCLEPQGMRAY